MDSGQLKILKPILIISFSSEIMIKKRGKKVQAIIRDEPNTFGIPTKKKPYLSPCSYYSDQEYNENIKKNR
jgi:hypothetical protein